MPDREPQRWILSPSYARVACPVSARAGEPKSAPAGAPCTPNTHARSSSCRLGPRPRSSSLAERRRAYILRSSSALLERVREGGAHDSSRDPCQELWGTVSSRLGARKRRQTRWAGRTVVELRRLDRRGVRGLCLSNLFLTRKSSHSRSPNTILRLVS